MNETTYKTMTLSSAGLSSRLQGLRLSFFVGYSVRTQTILSPSPKAKAHVKEAIKKSLERSLKENADVWAELAKH